MSMYYGKTIKCQFCNMFGSRGLSIVPQGEKGRALPLPQPCFRVKMRIALESAVGLPKYGCSYRTVYVLAGTHVG
jgi:hypothetical protein